MEVQKELRRLIIRKVELDSIREKMKNLLVNASNFKSVVFTASMITRYSKSDIPMIILDICEKDIPDPKLLCKEIYAAYLLLLNEQYRNAVEFLREYHSYTTNENEMIDSGLLKLSELSVLFNA